MSRKVALQRAFTYNSCVDYVFKYLYVRSETEEKVMHFSHMMLFYLLEEKKTLYKQQNSMCCLLGCCYSWTLSGLLNIEQKNLDSSGRLVDDQTEQLIKSGHHCTGHCRDSSHNEYELLSHWTLLHTLIATMFEFFSY